MVQIDTTQDAGWLRMNLNDGPPLFDGNPERHDAPGAFQGPSAPDSILVQDAPESARQIADAVIAAGYGDAETFALTLDTEPIGAHAVRALMAKAVRAAFGTLALQVADVREALAASAAAAEGDSNDAELDAAHSLREAAAWLADSVDSGMR
ncbi:hypothetical protein [Microbacterium testaceum]|uniref:hypothetical protein n=1 Tax=Microbacterium testaceum TaxID=2033 RepID=UPI002AC6467A|nr:hypothetical protein [Microbacterium testaceum]MDZ5146118.1 hypothetical protein [Microbacterium testaceum]